MCYLIKPLAVSAHLDCAQGEVFCFSAYQKVINLIDKKSHIVTLHAYNYGISPMGWLLKTSDFIEVYDNIVQHKSNIYQLESGDLQIGDLVLSNQCRKLNMTMGQSVTIKKEIIQTLFSPIKKRTGMFGELGSQINHPLDNSLQSLMLEILKFIDEQPFDIKNFIGLGPGLTPTFDDILVGIFAVLYTDKSLQKQLPTMKSHLNQSTLELLTTKISATFLTYAFSGTFTLNLLAVISSIRQYNQNRLSIKKLLSYGHSSGADLLLGIWIGSLILEQCYDDKRC